MKFSLPESDPSTVKSKVLEALGGRELGKIVNFDFAADNLTVTINKLGKSKLIFDQKHTGEGLVYTLVNEKIAFSHKAFKGEVVTKLLNVIEGVGGTIIET